MSNKNIYVKRFYFIASIFLLVLVIITSDPLYAKNYPSEIKSEKIEDSIKKRFKDWGIKSLGFQTGVVLTDKLDVGIGFGAQLQKKFFHPLLEHTPSLYFWGASNDSLDVSSLGIEESVTIKKSLTGKFYVFSGLTFGYYFAKEKQNIIENNSLKINENNRKLFEIFINIGSIYTLKNNRSVFTKFKYGLTHDSIEMHIIAGINFYL